MRKRITMPRTRRWPRRIDDDDKHVFSITTTCGASVQRRRHKCYHKRRC